MRVLVVDDDIDIATLARLALEAREATVYVANTVEEAAKLLNGGTFDAVVTDLRMSKDTSGLDVLRHVRRTQPDSCARFVWSAFIDAQDAKLMKAVRTDNVTVLQKPVSPALFASMVMGE